MPYNTRRKSLSLTELGITLPKRSRTHSQSSPSHANPNGNAAHGDEPPNKKSKRASSPSAASSHQTETKSPARKSVTTIRFKEEAEEKKKHSTPSGGAHQQQQQQQQQLSPPPSPVAEGARANRVDVEGINDDIVVATIRQLEQTGNRPHLVKELAAILSGCLDSAEKSTNPSALISSRLTAYINRPWPAVCPCPLAKDLTTAHPRRLYFYLNTLPRQPLPPSIATLAATSGSKNSGNKRRHNGTISPSLSSAENSSLSSAASASDDVSDDADTDALLMRQRQALSPSPEVDLSSPDLYDEAGGSEHRDQPGAPFSGRSSVDPGNSNTGFEGSGSSVGGRAGSGGTRGPRGASPQLENEERDFKRVATAVYEEEMRRRQRSRSATEGVKTEEVVEGGAVVKKEQEGSPSGGNSMMVTTTNEVGNGASSRSSPSSSSSAAASSEKMDVERSDNNERAENSGSISSTIENGTHGSFLTTMETEEDGEYASTEHQRQNREAAAALFGSEHLQHSPEMRSLGFFYGGSSPVIAPRDAPAALARDLGDDDEGCGIGGPDSRKSGLDEEGALELSADVSEVKKESSMDSDPGHNDDDKAGISIHGNGSTDIERGTTAASAKSLHHHGPVSRTASSPTKSASNEGAQRKDLNAMIIETAADEDAAMRAEVEADDWAKSLQSPETVELEELEDLFDAY